MSLTYCDVAPGHPFHGPYHDQDYGVPQTDESVLFERLVLEINQAGLSWLTILKKRDAFRRAYDGFDVAKVAAYGEADRQRLLSDPSIIRNRLKIDAAIFNAKRVLEMRSLRGGFADWLAAHHPVTKKEWLSLFLAEFKFVGGEIVGEFLMSLGYLPGAHRDGCPVGERLKEMDPPWLRATRAGFVY